MKKRLAVILGALLLLSGCGTGAAPNAGEADAAGSAPAASTEQAPDEEIGTVIRIPYNPSHLPAAPISFTDEETGPLLFSDAPEWVEGEGVLLKGSVPPGDFRFYLYHTSMDVPDKYFHVVLTNKGDKPATVRVTNHVLVGPDRPFGPVGMQAQTQFYRQAEPYQFTIPVGGRADIDPRLAEAPGKYNALLFGIWDVVTDQPLEVHEVATSSPELPDPSQYQPLEQTEDSGAGAGTFPNYRRRVLVRLDGSRQMYKLASNEGEDRWLAGIDELRGGKAATNVGNYGMDYDVTMEFNSPVDRRVRVYMTSVYQLAGAIRVDGRMMPIPRIAAPDTPGAPWEAVLIAKLDLPAGKAVRFRYEFMPPGSFYLPAIVHVVPDDQ